MVIMNLRSKLLTWSILDQAIVAPLVYPDRKDMKIWSENTLKSYADLLKKRMDNGTYETEEKYISKFIEWVAEINKNIDGDICSHCDLDMPNCNLCIES